mmetsp:Transcript_10827/g.12184  ORF Transcript_10827/g.12184 Transcript_10827/m.12184 type:complete len:125 (+) Transcript_10827:334-708(+)
MVELLLKAGANTELRTQQDMSALLTAVTRNKPKIVNLLLKFGAKINLDSKNGGIKKLTKESDERVHTVIRFHREWRRKKNFIVLLDHLENDIGGEVSKEQERPDNLDVIMSKKGLLKSIIKDYM